MVSPIAMIEIIAKIETALWKHESIQNYHDIEGYLSRWQEGTIIRTDSNYDPFTDTEYTIHTREALASFSDDMLLQIAVNLDIEIPWLIYSVAEIKGILDDRYEDVGRKFEEACKEVYSDPSVAIIKANSALESLIKKICKDELIENCDPKAGIYELTEHVLKQFDFLPDKKLNLRIRDIGSGLFKASRTIGEIRNKHTVAHSIDKTISDPLYAVFVVNSVATIGQLLLNYYEHRYKPQNIGQSSLDDDEIPF